MLHIARPARFFRGLALAACAVLACGLLRAQQGQGPTNAGGIYSCVDASGRTITSDRPIPACFDREQVELTPSGTVRRRIEPRYTARELEQREARQREAEQAALRAREERRRERALLVRYPNAATHDRERGEAMKQIDAVIGAARTRLGELAEERRKIDGEMEFYKKDPSKAPPSLRRQLEDNDQSAAVQNRFIAEQDAEKRRVNARFDEERTRLVQLWSPENGGTAQRPAP
ncbi:MAG: DUF4124 domain-containing protein [Rhodocyclaceae bacterium]|nr:DUF4124 domain-containing protein [Pseudomonadota bacterium]MDQ7972453.1 DUF4124 domain-containing protein [Rhodocyclaceae bacterium]MDQ7998978.1 DUF4124 domain-containing protein [Pseudomonadota bacterium]